MRISNGVSRFSVRLVMAAAGGVLGASVGAQAQVASALLREGEPLSEGVGAISAINNSAVNHQGGYAFTVNTDTNSVSHVWGNLSGGTGAILRTEGVFDGVTQTAFETFFGISNTHVVYSPTGTGGPVGAFDSVFRDDEIIAIEGDPCPKLPGQFWRFSSRPSTTAAGDVWFVAGLALTPGGTTSSRGLFVGGEAKSAVLRSGDMVPGLDNPLNTGTAVDFDFRVSASGEHYIAPVVTTGPTAMDSAIVIDGAAAMAGEALLREGTVVPASVGGNGVEAYQTFDLMGITDTGRWMVTGDTNAAATTDEYVMLDGVMVLRDGAVLGKHTVQGDIEGAYLNNDGDYAVIWDVAANTREVLIINGQIVLVEGQSVDWTGDGTIDEGAVLTDFTGISTLTLSDRIDGRVDAYFTADINVNGTVREGAFRLSFSVGGPTCACDWNVDDVLNSQDFFDFLTDFFKANADFNADGTTNSQDFFDFLTCFFEGC